MKSGAFSAFTHEVSGLIGFAKNDAMTAWAHGECGETKCPAPGIVIIVALAKRAATVLVHAGDVTASQPPEMSSVGIGLTTGRRESGEATGTFQTSRQSSLA